MTDIALRMAISVIVIKLCERLIEIIEAALRQRREESEKSSDKTQNNRAKYRKVRKTEGDFT